MPELTATRSGFWRTHGHSRNDNERVCLSRSSPRGAWITAIIVPALIIAMSAVKSHYDRLAHQIAVDCPVRRKL
jgi:hypothetical protein